MPGTFSKECVMTELRPSDFAAIIGIDWADKTHAICLKIPGLDTCEIAELAHTPEAIDDWACALKERFPNGTIAVALEQKKGPLLYALLKYDHLVLYPVHPMTAAKYRQTWAPSRAKDDPTDAQFLLELLERHHDRLHAWTPQSKSIRQLGQLVEMRRRLVGDKVRITNRLTAALKNYYPLVLGLFDQKDTIIFCDFLDTWPSLKQAKHARQDTLIRFFKAHNAQYETTNRDRIDRIKKATALTCDEGVIMPNRLLAGALVAQLRTTILSIQTFDQNIQELYEEHADAPIFDSLPGAAKTYAPRLLAAFGEDRDRYQCADEILQYAGIAPVIERSGQKCWTHWRYSCPKFLRQSFVEWAGQSIRFSFWASAYYQMQKERGKSHQVAIRALAFKWIRILFRCWKNRTPYDESVYLKALQKRRSPLLENIAGNP